jgi:hypothetical protein
MVKIKLDNDWYSGQLRVGGIRFLLLKFFLFLEFFVQCIIFKLCRNPIEIERMEYQERMEKEYDGYMKSKYGNIEMESKQ